MIEQQNNYKGFVEENLSNLTSPISGEASVSSSSKQSHVFSHQTHEQFHHSNDDDDDNDDGDEHPPAKKKRNLPGNPDPESEVIALSPRTLQATNRFTCEICNKGFQRDQNLQLHRRGHNLPWKLKQRSKTEVVKKKVYVCPEQTCVHHHPSRALGDLTGIKKHFSRKHCDKKWKCDKCSKRYAVHSDWKAHSKVCGTREYRCDCGTLFSRRDSFITHRAFCDALAEETARAITTTTTISSSAALTINTHFMNDNNSDHHHLHATFPLKREQHHHLPPWLACPPIPSPSSSSSSIFQHQDQNPNTAGLLPAVTVSSSHMSATALLQKAAQMEATMSITSLHHHRNHHSHVADNNVPNTTCTLPGGMFGLDVSTSSSSFNHHDMYDGAFGVGNMGMKNPSSTFRQTPGGRGGGGGGGEGMTRDFLGLKPLIQNDIFTLAALGNCMTSTNVVSTTTTTTTSTHNHHQQETHKPWQS